MHRAIAGFNLWAVAFLLLAAVLGYLGSPYHLPVGIFGVLFAMLAQSIIFALFMGAYWLLKEHVAMFGLNEHLVTRAKGVMIPLFRWATVGSLGPLLVGLLGGLGASGDVAPWLHAWLGVGVAALVVVTTMRELPHLVAMHAILQDMEAALPEKPAPVPAAPVDLRPRALVYVGSTALVMTLGYRYIAGIQLPATLFGTALTLAGLCLVVATFLHLRRAS